MGRSRSALVACVAALLFAGCSGGGAGEGVAAAPPASPPAGPSTPPEPEAPSPSRRPATPTPAAATPTTPAPPPSPAEPAVPARPAWLGTRPLPLRPDGFGEVLPTPPELTDRRLPPGGALGAPEGDAFAATVEPVGDDVLARSTWSPACPVAREDLRYVTVTFWGFDDRAHTGELLVHADAAQELVTVFASLHQARFPVEDMRIVTREELDAAPTGDGNNTTAFVCRPTTGGTSWSQHAYGLAIDVNPFHNPYVRRDLVLPELASAYLDRAWVRPGMITAGDTTTAAFAAAGWEWGGAWSSPTDPMHFSRDGG